MNWSTDSLYNKAKLYAQRAHDEPVDSSLFGFWMSLSLELLARSALAQIHPALLADPREPDNIQYAFGINPKKLPKSIQAKTVFARCSVFIGDFTDKMSGHCLIMTDRRNAELHTGEAAFEGIDNSKWLPATYEVIEVLLKHVGRDFKDFLGEDHGAFAAETLRDRRDTIIREVQEKIASARKFFDGADSEWKAQRAAAVAAGLGDILKLGRTHRKCKCPSCGNDAVLSGEILARSPARIDESGGAITREARVLPNSLNCPFCKLNLSGYQELREAQLGNIYSIEEQEDPIEFFGINPEEYVNIDQLIENYYQPEYDNE